MCFACGVVKLLLMFYWVCSLNIMSSRITDSCKRNTAGSPRLFFSLPYSLFLPLPFSCIPLFQYRWNSNVGIVHTKQASTTCSKTKLQSLSFWKRILLCNSGLHQTCHPFTFTSILKLKMYTKIPGYCFHDKTVFYFICVPYFLI